MITLAGRRSAAALTRRQAARTSNPIFRTRCAGISIQHQRPIHATSAVQFSSPQQPIATNDIDAGEKKKKKKSGFVSLLNRGGNSGQDNNSRAKQPKPTSDNFQGASSTVTNPHDEQKEEDWGVEDDDNSNLMSDTHDFGENEYESDLQNWHKTKEEEFHHLVNSTNGADTAEPETILSLMQDWNTFLSSMTSELHGLNEFRRQNQHYPPSEFMTNMTHDAAEKVGSLLAQLVEDDSNSSSSLPPEVEVNAYKLAMIAWSHVFHPQSGDRCELILEQYGERFGGDMNYMPTLDAYKIVLEAHLKSCSSYPYPYTPDNNGGSSPGEKALSLLQLLSNLQVAGDMYLNPDTEVYSQSIAVVRNTLLDWQCRRRFLRNDLQLEKDLSSRLLNAFEQMESNLLEEMRKCKQKGEIMQLPLHRWHYAIRAYADALAIAATIPNYENNDNIASNLLAKLEQFITNNSASILLSVADAGLSDSDVQGVMGEIQQKIEQSYTSALSAELTLSKEMGKFRSFNNAVSNAETSQQLFEGMKHRSQESSPDTSFLFPPPTCENYQSLIECWCECLRKCYYSPESNFAMGSLEEYPHLKAESLLKQLEVQYAGKPIDGNAYISVIWAWSQVMNWSVIIKTSDYSFASRGMDDMLMKAMDGYANGTAHFQHGLVTKMYNFVFRLNSKIFRGGEWAKKRSLNLLDQMEVWFEESEGKIARPDKQTFALILKTIANSGASSSAFEAEKMLKRMESYGINPGVKHYLGVMRAYSRVGGKDGHDPRKAETILRHVKEKYNENKSLKPNTAIYSACITSYGASKKHNSVSKVMELFEELKELYKETEDEAFKPDNMLYSAVLDALSKANTKKSQSLNQAIEMLGVMEREYDEGHIDVGPNRYAYTNLIRSISFSRAPDGALLAEDLMQRMVERSKLMDDESIRPDTHAYTSLISMLSGSGEPDAVERALKWFDLMEKQYQGGDGSCKPNKVTCTALMNCWRHSGRPDAGDEAEKILTMMEEKFDEGDLDLKPDAFVYASAIDSWARSNSLDKAERAWNVYEFMKAQYLSGNMEARPNNIIMTSIIKACGYTRGDRKNREKALKVLLKCMAEVKREKVINTNPLTFRTSLNAAKALVMDNDKRRPIAAAIFETCCRHGQLDDSVLKMLQDMQPDLYKLLPAEIPLRWKQNVETRKKASRWK